MPGHEFFDKHVVYSAPSLHHGQALGVEDLSQLFQVSFGQAIEGPVRSKEPVCYDSVKMGMKPGVIPDGVDHHDHPQDPLIEAQYRGLGRRRPTLPRGRPRSTIGAEELNDRVRDENGCGLLAITTGPKGKAEG
jgi:hypothetical protein